MTDVAGILASYRSGQIDEADMIEICKTWPEVETALIETSITKRGSATTEATLASCRCGSEPVWGRLTFYDAQGNLIRHHAIRCLHCHYWFYVNGDKEKTAKRWDEAARRNIAVLTAALATAQAAAQEQRIVGLERALDAAHYYIDASDQELLDAVTTRGEVLTRARVLRDSADPDHIARAALGEQQ